MYSDDDDDDYTNNNVNFTNFQTNNVKTKTSSSSSSSIICINCGSSNFYRDDQTDALICNSCFTQSQSQSQRETTDYDEAMAVAATRGGRLIESKSSKGRLRGRGRRRGGNKNRQQQQQGLPSIMDFCYAFQILLKKATMRLGELASPVPVAPLLPTNDYDDNDDDCNNPIEKQQEQKEHEQKIIQFQKNLLSKVKYIWFSYLITWNKAANYYSQLYPECRISFRDYFLQQYVRTNLMKYLTAKSVHNINQSIQKVKLENDHDGVDEIIDSSFYNKFMDEELNRKEHHVHHDTDISYTHTRVTSKNGQSFHDYSNDRNRQRRSVVKWEDDIISKNLNNDFINSNNKDDDSDPSDSEVNTEDWSTYLPKEKKEKNQTRKNLKKKNVAYYRQPVDRFQKMLKETDGRIDNNTIHPYYAVFKVKPNLNLMSSIIYLALLQCNIGIASNHIVSWAYSGLYPFLLNGLKHLPTDLQDHFKRCSCVYSFQQKMIPKPGLLDYYADLLVISLGLDNEDRVKSNNCGDDQLNNNVVLMQRKVKGDKKSYTFRQMNNFPYYLRHTLRMRLAPPQKENDFENGNQSKKATVGKKQKRKIGKESYDEDEKKFKTKKRRRTKDPELSTSTSIQSPDLSTKMDTEINNMLLGQLTPDHHETENQDHHQQQQLLSTETTTKSPSTSIQYYQENIPLMAYRFVTDLGLSQRVLDITLSLMGFEVIPQNNCHQKNNDESNECQDQKVLFDINTFLPAPLNNASIDKIASPVHIMAVIVVACKMCFGWEQWKIYLSPHLIFGDNLDKRMRKENRNDKNDDVSDGNDSDDVEKLSRKSYKNDESRRTKNKFQKRFIPWTQDDVNLIGNGKMLNDYFDFIEETYGDDLPKTKWSDDVVAMIDSKIMVDKRTKVENESTKLCYDNNDTVMANTVIAGATNPNMPAMIRSKNNEFFFHFLRMRNIGAIWADANGLGEYVVYNDMTKHAKTSKTFGPDEVTRITSESFHPHYSLLIEYVADKLFVEPGELHYLVTCLDEEIIHYRRPELDWSLNQNKSKSSK